MSFVVVQRIFVGAWFLVAAGLFAYVMTRQPLANIGEACVAMGPAVVLAPLIGFTCLLTRAALLRCVLGGPMAWRSLVAVRIVGDGYNALVPAAGLAGEPLKLRRLVRWMPAERAVAGLVRDRLVDNALGLVFSAAGVAVGLAQLCLPGLARGALCAYCALAAPAGLVMLAIACTRVPGRFGGLASRWTSAARRGPQPRPARHMLGAIGWAVATRVVQMLETALLMRCIGAPISIATVALVDGGLNAAGFVGFLLPQGLGVVEGSAICVLGALGCAPAAATAFALARRGRVIIVGALGIAWHLGGHAVAWLARYGRRVIV